MRTYGSNYKAHPKTQERTKYADYKNREATEWDVRIDLVNGMTSSKIFDRLVNFKDKFDYVLLGAEERPDDAGAGKHLSTEDHVHIAVIMKKMSKREEVLDLMRGPRSLGPGKEYCVPRNPKFSYAGWVMHHTKKQYKINPDGPLQLYEHGDLPMDAYDEKTCWAVIRMINKFGNIKMKERFKSYQDKIEFYKLANQLDDLDKIPPVADGYAIPEIQKILGGEIKKID